MWHGSSHEGGDTQDVGGCKNARVFLLKKASFGEKIVKKPSPKALSDAVIQRHVFFKNNNRSTMLDKDMKKWLPKRAGTRPAHEA